MHHSLHPTSYLRHCLQIPHHHPNHINTTHHHHPGGEEFWPPGERGEEFGPGLGRPGGPAKATPEAEKRSNSKPPPSIGVGHWRIPKSKLPNREQVFLLWGGEIQCHWPLVSCRFSRAGVFFPPLFAGPHLPSHMLFVLAPPHSRLGDSDHLPLQASWFSQSWLVKDQSLPLRDDYLSLMCLVPFQATRSHSYY